MIGESNQSVFLIQIDASSFAKFEIFEFEIIRDDYYSYLQQLSLSWLVESACKYRLRGQSMEELCKHNAKVAESLERPQVCIWSLALNLYHTWID